MIAAKHLLALLRSHIDNDDEQFLSVALQVAASEARKGHGKLATQLRDIVDEARSKSTKNVNCPVLLAQPRGDLGALISTSYSDIRLSGMILFSELENQLKRIVFEYRQQHLLQAYGLSPRRKILLIGPPGSGKTMTASALAGELSLPLFTVVFESLITRFMGETASKLKLIFDAMAETRGVYFFDEFDAIGSRRAQSNDIGEIRRVLNSFLQLLENDDSDSLIVAATNHPDLLDSALFRRFDDVIRYCLPSAEIAASILKAKLSTFETNDLAWDDIIKDTDGFSQAELARVAEAAAKLAVLNGSFAITQNDVRAAILDRKVSSTH